MGEQSGRDAAKQAKYERLGTYLGHDPENHALLVDTAEAAIDAGHGEAARELLERASAISAPGIRERNLSGLAAMHAGRFSTAAAVFAALLGDGNDNAAVRFNLAWSLAMAGDETGALAVLDDGTSEALAQAAALDVQLRHAAGDFDEAYVRGKRHLERFPDDRALSAAMSVLALDIEDPTLAAACAAKAPDHPDALATLGTLALGSSDTAGARALFDEALARNPDAPRAWVGRGLAGLLDGEAGPAAADIDRGAALFGDHLGSWIAAGWAYFVGGDLVTGRARFEHALAIDDTFAETHGSLAVLDILAGDVVAGRERARVALRLDRQCYSAMLAEAMLSAGDGDPAKSRAIIERALNNPIDAGGRTLGQALARIGTGALSIH